MRLIGLVFIAYTINTRPIRFFIQQLFTQKRLAIQHIIYMC